MVKLSAPARAKIKLKCNFIACRISSTSVLLGQGVQSSPKPRKEATSDCTARDLFLTDAGRGRIQKRWPKPQPNKPLPSDTFERRIGDSPMLKIREF